MKCRGLRREQSSVKIVAAFSKRYGRIIHSTTMTDGIALKPNNAIGLTVEDPQTENAFQSNDELLQDAKEYYERTSYFLPYVNFEV